MSSSKKIAGVSAREVPGVHALGGGVQRAFGAVRERIPGASTNVAQGVGVEVGEKEAAIDLEIVVEYGVPIPDLVNGVRRNTVGAVERMTGLNVIEVNIDVVDIYQPEDSADSAEPRVE